MEGDVGLDTIRVVVLEEGIICSVTDHLLVELVAWRRRTERQGRPHFRARGVDWPGRDPATAAPGRPGGGAEMSTETVSALLQKHLDALSHQKLRRAVRDCGLN